MKSVGYGLLYKDGSINKTIYPSKLDAVAAKLEMLNPSDWEVVSLSAESVYEKGGVLKLYG